ncbi:hypothetical protein E4T42_07523 [Aureobasidium subglaciale]|nr:hypothetical protein E4T42_07523 [Aureobasidium subglaciale]
MFLFLCLDLVYELASKPSKGPPLLPDWSVLSPLGWRWAFDDPSYSRPCTSSSLVMVEILSATFSPLG